MKNKLALLPKETQSRILLSEIRHAILDNMTDAAMRPGLYRGLNNFLRLHRRAGEIVQSEKSSIKGEYLRNPLFTVYPKSHKTLTSEYPARFQELLLRMMNSKLQVDDNIRGDMAPIHQIIMKHCPIEFIKPWAFYPRNRLYTEGVGENPNAAWVNDSEELKGLCTNSFVNYNGQKILCPESWIDSNMARGVARNPNNLWINDNDFEWSEANHDTAYAEGAAENPNFKLINDLKFKQFCMRNAVRKPLPIGVGSRMVQGAVKNRNCTWINDPDVQKWCSDNLGRSFSAELVLNPNSELVNDPNFQQLCMDDSNQGLRITPLASRNSNFKLVNDPEFEQWCLAHPNSAYASGAARNPNNSWINKPSFIDSFMQTLTMQDREAGSLSLFCGALRNPNCNWVNDPKFREWCEQNPRSLRAKAAAANPRRILQDATNAKFEEMLAGANQLSETDFSYRVLSDLGFNLQLVA